MKTRKQILMLLLAMLVGIPTLSAQTKKEKKEQKKVMHTFVLCVMK